MFGFPWGKAFIRQNGITNKVANPNLEVEASENGSSENNKMFQEIFIQLQL